MARLIVATADWSARRDHISHVRIHLFTRIIAPADLSPCYVFHHALYCRMSSGQSITICAKRMPIWCALPSFNYVCRPNIYKG